jgi:tetratricopeptide (TPR) repeat protein
MRAVLAQDASPEQLFRDAVEAQKRGDDALAVTKYQELIKLRPDIVEAHANLGAALSHLHRFDEAIAEYERALAIAPDRIQIRANLALAYSKAGRLDRAATEFEALHNLAPQEERMTLLLADCWLQQGENRKVIALLEPLDAQYRDDLTFSYLYGTALMRDNQMDRGQQIMDRILRNGDSAQARVLMAGSRMRRMDWQGAKADLERAIAIDPTLPGVHSVYGLVLEEVMDAKASAQYQKELELNPNDFVANLHLGVYALNESRLDAAEAFLNHALVIRPGDPGALLQLASLRSAQNRRDEACQILEGITKRYPDFREAHVVLANLYYRLKRKADGDREHDLARKLGAQESAHIH